MITLRYPSQHLRVTLTMVTSPSLFAFGVNTYNVPAGSYHSLIPLSPCRRSPVTCHIFLLKARHNFSEKLTRYMYMPRSAQCNNAVPDTVHTRSDRVNMNRRSSRRDGTGIASFIHRSIRVDADGHITFLIRIRRDRRCIGRLTRPDRRNRRRRCFTRDESDPPSQSRSHLLRR